MATIYTRAGKGSALTWTEGDANVTNLNTAKIENVVEDTTPQLGGNLDVNGNSIVSVSNANIEIAPNGTGDVYLTADLERVGDSNANATITTNGTGDLILSTNSGTNSGVITIQDGLDNDITVVPAGTGKVHFETSETRVGINNTNAKITTKGTGDLTLDTHSGTNSGSIVIADGINGNITLSPNGTGKVIITNLQVDGTTTTVNSTTVTVDDPIFTLGGDTAPSADDNKDRGIEFRWHDGAAAKVGFFGFDDSTGYLTFIPDATNTSEVFTGTQGDIQATNFRGALVGNASTATTATTATGATNVNVSTTDGNTGDTTMYPLLVAANSTGNQLPHIDGAGLSYNATTNALSATQFVGAHDGMVGSVTPAAGTFTSLTASSANVNVILSPTGTGTVAISPAGALTINPTTASTINNTSIGATTASTGRFTTVTSTIATGTAPFTVASTTNVANLNASSLNGATFASPGAIGGTTKAAGTFTTMTADTAVLDDIRETVFALTYGATITPDAANGSIQTVTLTGNVTFSAFSNPVSGQTITLIITQDATGSRTLTSTMKFAGSSKTLSTAGSSIDILTVSYIGTTYYASLAKAFA